MAAEAALRWRDDGEGFGRAIVLAIGLHVLLAVLFWVFAILDLSRAMPAAAGQPVINADLNVSSAEAAAAREALAFTPPQPAEPQPMPEPVEEDTVPPPQPMPEPIPDDAVVERQIQVQERVPVPDDVQQQEVRDDAVSERTREREQEEKRRQEQVDLTERERQRDAEQRQRLAAQAEEAEKKRIEREKKLAAIRAERAKLQQQTQMSEQRLRQIADAEATRASEAAVRSDVAASGNPPAGNNGAAVDDGLRARYAAAIQVAVTAKWTRPDNVPAAPCRMTIKQLPGGEVMSVEFSASCPYDEAGKRSVEAAVLKAQPLPYAGFESVFSRTLNFTFRPSN